ncbi:MAG: hypothetical protein ACRD0I_04590 [Acidimicrobiales bacterium]
MSQAATITDIDESIGVAPTIRILPWVDPVIDQLGHDPRSSYVETYWLGILGPSTTWLIRRMAAELDVAPLGIDIDMADMAGCLGLGVHQGRNSPFARSLCRMVDFGVARPHGQLALEIRRKLPGLTRRQLMRLPSSLQERHRRHLESELNVPAVEHLRQRSRQLALSLMELGDDLESAERQLMRWRFHPALARESACWAWERHVAASQACTSSTSVRTP